MDDDLTLVEVLARNFSLDELEFLAVRLGMNPTEHLAPHDTPRTFALKLQQHFEARGQLAALEAEVRKERAHLAWRSPGGRGAAGQPAQLHNVPELPKYVLPRPEEVAALRALLLAEGSSAVGIVGARRADERVVGVRGMGGIGKTMLATVLAHDDALREHFTGGIFWLTLGEGASEAALLTHQTSLARALGDSSAAFTDLRAGKVRLRELLTDRCCLLLLDDVWQSDHAEPFAALGPRGRLLLTTRDAQVLNELDATEYPLDLLGEPQALGLLAWWAKQTVESLPPQTSAIAAECGYLPLALAMVGALVGDGTDSWESALAMLRARDLEAIRRRVGADYAYPSLWRAIEVSVATLPADLRDRYADFALFPTDTPIPPTVLATLWQHEGLAPHLVPRCINTLEKRSLLRKDDAGCLTLHDLQLDFVQRQTRDLPSQHQRLLAAYAAHCPAGWASGPDDGYFFQQFPYHLIAAGRATDLAALLLDYRWLRARLHATDIVALLGDFERLPLPLPRYHPTDFPSPGSPAHALSALQDSLRKSAHVLARDRSHLPAHLLGRLLDEPLPSLALLLQQASQDPTPPFWLCPLTASLQPPGGPLLRTLARHTGWVKSVALSGDGRLAVSTADDSTLKVWEVATGRELHTLVGHRKWVNSVALSADGRLAVSASEDGTLKVWEVATGRELHTLTGHTGWVLGVALNGDGRLAVSASADETLKVWEVATGRELHTLAGHSDWVNSVALSGDGRLAVSASDDGTLKVWEVDTGRERYTLAGHTARVTSVALSRAGWLALSAASDYTLKVWEVATGRELHTLIGHTGGVYGVALSGDGRLALSASEDGTVQVWDVGAGRAMQARTGHTGWMTSVALSGDGRLALSASADGMLKVWEVVTERERYTPTRHTGWVRGVTLSGDGRLAISAADDGTLKVWEVATGRELYTLTERAGWVRGVAVSGDGRLVASASSDGTLKIWAMATGRELHVLRGHTGGVWGVALSGDGQLAVSAAEDGTLKVWEVDTGREQRTLVWHTGNVWGVALSRDGRLAVSASADGTLKVWEVATGRWMATLGGHAEGVNGVALSGDGRLAVSASEDRTLKVWEVATGRLMATLSGHTGGVNGVALSGDGRLAVSASNDGTLKVWEVDAGHCLTTFETDETLYCCAFAPPFIVAGGQSGRVHFLRLMM